MDVHKFGYISIEAWMEREDTWGGVWCQKGEDWAVRFDLVLVICVSF